MSQFVEVVVNIPIRRAFSSAPKPPSTDLPGFEGADSAHRLGGGPAQYQTFHYHLPPELLEQVHPGHLVWVPFGHQEVQGIVLAQTESAPVQTKAVDRLARPKPVLTPHQITLAYWIADRYIAPLSESLKLFIPPGLLHKADGAPGVRVKREEQIRLAISPEEIPQKLGTVGRASKQVKVLTALLEASQGGQTESSLAKEALTKACKLRSDSTFNTLAQKGLIRVDDERVSLALSAPETREAMLDLRGATKYRPILDALAQAAAPLWKSDLYALVGEADASADRQMLRDLRKAGLIQIEEQVRLRDPLAGQIYPRTHAPHFTDQQQAVWEEIQAQIFPENDAGSGSGDAEPENPEPGKIRHHACLLHGVTGSGKTEIYLRAIEETLARGRQAIVLVPEIALTPQTVARFAGRFPNRVSVIHSDLSTGERYDVWRQIRDEEIDVVVGPRSALFAPLPRLGLIVIDEEHESSYKQNAEAWGSFTVFYDARTVAEEMARLTRSGLILGSATPSLERYFASQQGEVSLLEMPQRVMGHQVQAADGSSRPLYAEMPPVEVVDMRQELRANHRSIFSRSLTAQLHETLAAGEQAILFLNRRGSSTFVLCRDCGHVEECDRCDVPLTYHERANVLICHHCNKRFPIPTVCPEPECGSRRIKYFGSGTQRIVDQVTQLIPHARVQRWDADTTSSKGSHQAILSSFAAHEADVLVGTQMIAKGLDLPLVTLVGVISADVGLYLPDFRSPERTFQLLMQVAGRAGRSHRGGRVIFQSYTPDHYAIQAAAEHDYHAFYAREIQFRREQGYPPLSRLARLIFWDKKLAKVEAETKAMAERLRYRAEQMGLSGEQMQILGPAPAFFPRYRGFYRWQVILRAVDPSAFLLGVEIPFGWRVDVDPISLL